jgi:hypothetical protein
MEKTELTGLLTQIQQIEQLLGNMRSHLQDYLNEENPIPHPPQSP